MKQAAFCIGIETSGVRLELALFDMSNLHIPQKMAVVSREGRSAGMTALDGVMVFVDKLGKP